MIAIDTETTGKDFFHGAKPFLVTTAKDDETQTWWEWDVNPLTREPIIPPEDVEAVDSFIRDSEGPYIFQNAKFDVTALRVLGAAIANRWPWKQTEDTLLGGHLLASNMPHNLTAMGIQWLGYDIGPLEDTLKVITQEARRYVRTKLPQWRLAKEGLEDMPSVKASANMKKSGDSDAAWKADSWVPRALAKHLDYPQPDSECSHHWGDQHLCLVCGGHHYWTAALDYANADPAVTVKLWQVMEKEIRRLGLWEIYEVRRKVLPIAYQMEKRGITINKDRLVKLREKYQRESQEQAKTCQQIASQHKDDEGKPYQLTLPKAGNNKSLIRFAFGYGHAWCTVCREDKELTLWQAQSAAKRKDLTCNFCKEKGITDSKVRVEAYPLLNLPVVNTTDNGNPSLDKFAMEEYEATLPDGPQLTFIKSLGGKRKQDTALSFMDNYERFWKPWVPAWDGAVDEMTGAGWYVLHPSLNPTGTNTLRWSSSNPNEQNISKKEGFNLRYTFGPAPGREWWSMDAQNIELRIPTFEAVENDLIEVFLHPDRAPYYGSYHYVIFDLLHPELFKKHGKDCKKLFGATWYQWVKNGNFAIIYGAQEETADRTYHVPGAYQLIQDRFPAIAALNRRMQDTANRTGYVETIPDKSVNPKRGYPLMCTRTEYGKVLPTVPLNYHVQGTAMWWTMMFQIQAHTLLQEWNEDIPEERLEGSGYFIAMQVHDEIVFDFPKRAHPLKNPKGSNLRRVRKLQEIALECGNNIGIPTPTGIEYHEENWSEGDTIP